MLSPGPGARRRAKIKAHQTFPWEPNSGSQAHGGLKGSDNTETRKHCYRTLAVLTNKDRARCSTHKISCNPHLGSGPICTAFFFAFVCLMPTLFPPEFLLRYALSVAV